MQNQNREKTIVVFVKEHLLIGGIETYVYQIAKKLKSEGTQVVWVKKKWSKIDPSFKSEFFDQKTILMDGLDCKKMAEIVADSQTRIKIVTFDLYYFAVAEKFKRDFNICPVDTFYFVSHYRGDTLYIQDSYKGKKSNQVKLEVGKIIRKMNENSNIKYFACKHIERMTDDYDFQISDQISQLIPPAFSTDSDFDKNRCIELAKRDRFNILTVSRLEFPHKGYVLGLIKAYASLKEKYPNIELTIIGYGSRENEVKAKISELPSNIAKDVHFVGKTAPEKLKEYYDDANINISLAGCFSQGARNGTLSIPARHHNYDCEVYGFLPESKPFSLSEAPGEPVIPYIEQVLNMTAEEYCEKCRACFYAYNNDADKQRLDFYQIQNVSNSTLSSKEMRYLFRKKERILRRRPRLKDVIGVFRREGIIKPVIRRIKKTFKKK